MKLTPLDIRHKEFHRGMRGYADAEVDEFLDLVADEFERVFKQNLDLAERIEALQQQIEHYRGIEATLQKTLLSAQQSAEDMRSGANKEAQLVLRDAEVKARDTLSDAYAARQQVEREIVMLKSSEAEFRFKFRALLEGFLKQLAAAEGGARERASQFEQQAQALREAIVAGRSELPTSGPGAPPAGPPVEGPATSTQKPAPPSPEVKRPGGQPPVQPGPPAAVAAPHESSTPPDEEGEDTAVIAATDQTVEVRPLTEEEDDFFSDVDHKARGNDFRW
jgi:cell division initiation protein